MSPIINGDYLPTQAGQIHLRQIAAEGDESRPPLLCLHPAPYSGRYFSTVMPMLNAGRRVLAPDYPGYGNSYRLAEPPSIGDYASAMIDSVLANEAAQLDLLGFHSGCLVAAEIALVAPEKVRRLLLVDIPWFDRETQAAFAGKVAQPMPLSFDAACLGKAWDFNVASRENIVPLERALELFVDQLSSGTKDYFCFHAAFSYDCVGRFARIDTPTTIIATQSPLHQATLSAARALPDATLIDEESITTSVFERGATTIAKHIRSALDRD